MKRLTGTLATIGALVAIVYVKTHAAPPPAAPSPAAAGSDDEDRLVARCHGDYSTPSCAVLAASVVADALDALEELRWSKDRRAVPTALEALKVDEPAVQLAALQILEGYPTEPGVVDAVCLQLANPHTLLAEEAASMCGQSTSAEIVAIVKQFRDAHSGSTSASAYDESGPPMPDMVAAKVLLYPGAQHYAPGDGTGVYGYSTTDPVAKVAKFYAAHSTEKPLTLAAWRAAATPSESTEQAEADFKNDPDMVEAQRLALQMSNGHTDPKTMKRMQELQKKLQDKAMTAAKKAAPGATALAGPPGAASEATFQGYVLERRDQVIVRAVAIYREEALGRTVIQVAMDGLVFTPP